MMEERERLTYTSESAPEEGHARSEPGSRLGYMARGGAIWGTVGLVAAGVATGATAILASIVTGGPHGAAFVAAVATAAAGTGPTATLAGVVGGAARGKHRHEQEALARQHEVELTHTKEASELAQSNTEKEVEVLREERDKATEELEAKGDALRAKDLELEAKNQALGAAKRRAEAAEQLAKEHANEIALYASGDATIEMITLRDDYRSKLSDTKAELATEKERAAVLEAKLVVKSAELVDVTEDRDRLQRLYDGSLKYIQDLKDELSSLTRKILQLESSLSEINANVGRAMEAKCVSMREDMMRQLRREMGLPQVETARDPMSSMPKPNSATQYRAVLMSDKQDGSAKEELVSATYCGDM